MTFSDVDLARLLIALAILLLAAHGVGSLFSRFGQPAAIGEILGGVLLGPSAAALGAVYQLGLLLLMFAAGTQMRRLVQRDAARTVGLIASFGLVLPFAAGLGLVTALGAARFIGPAANHPALTLVFGMAVAVTSIPVISRIMHDLGLLRTRFARIVLCVAVIEDVVLYVVLAVAVGLVPTSGSTAFGLPTALSIHGLAQNGIYHTAVAVVFLGVALTVGGRVYRSLITTRANPLARRSPVAFQLLWMLALSAGAPGPRPGPPCGAVLAGISVAIADDSIADSRDGLLVGLVRSHRRTPPA